jgi:DNA polymerase-3 subunit gamma/tau
VELTLLKITYLPSVYQPAAQPAVEGGAGKKSEAKPIAPAAVSPAPVSSAPIPEAPPVTPPVAAPVARPVAPAISEPVAALPDNPAPRPSGGHGLRSAKKVVSTNQSENASEVSLQGRAQNEPFTLEELNVVWTQIAQGFKQGNFINKYVMMNREISLVDTIIHMKVEGEVQIQQFNDSLKLELITQLREKLKNDFIDLSLDLIVGDVSDKKLIYTQSDKYDFLSQKHPILVEMKQRMGLDHEF